VKVVKGVYDKRLQMGIYEELSRRNRVIGLMWLVGCSTGYRVSDLLSIRVSDGLEGSLRIVEGKTGKIRCVRMDKGVYEAVRGQIRDMGLRSEDYLFGSSRERGKPISRQHAHRMIKAVGDELGCEGLGTHSMRKTYAYNALLETRNLGYVRRVMNHEYLSTTLFYVMDGLMVSLPKAGRMGVPVSETEDQDQEHGR